MVAREREDRDDGLAGGERPHEHAVVRRGRGHDPGRVAQHLVPGDEEQRQDRRGEDEERDLVGGPVAEEADVPICSKASRYKH